MKGIINKAIELTGGSQTAGYKGGTHYFASNMAKAGLVFAAMKAAGKPDVMLGLLPLYTIQSYEVGRSMEVLKFRAAKGQFFKQQEGHDVSLRIDLIITGPYREIILALIESAYVLGNNQDKKVLSSKVSNLDPSKLSGNILTQAGTNIAGMNVPINQGSMPPTKFEAVKAKDIGNVDDTKFNTDDWHDTFTFMSSTDVLFDIYIENYIVERSVRGGYNAIYVSLFCRKFNPPNIIKVEQVEKVNDIQKDANIPTKTYRGRHHAATSTVQHQNVTYHPRSYIDAKGISRIHTVPSFFNNVAPDVSNTTKTLYGTDYSNETTVVEGKQYKPNNADFLDFTIRAGMRLFRTFKRFRELELNFEMTETGIIPWNLGVDMESTRVPEINQVSIRTIKYKNPDIMYEHTNEGMYA